MLEGAEHEKMGEERAELVSIHSSCAIPCERGVIERLD